MGTSKIALEKAQAILKVDTGSGSLYDHLVRIVRKIAEEKPADALEQLETISRQLKQATFRGDAGPDGGVPVSADAAAEALQLQWCRDSLNLASSSIPCSPSDPASAPKVLAAVQNFIEDAHMFEWAGVGFGKQESYHIAMSLRALAAQTPSLESLRVWGKILGTEGDYYVAEGVLQSYGAKALEPDPVLKAAKALAAAAVENKNNKVYDEGGPMPPPPIVLPGTDYDVEPRGRGANYCAYWVSAGGAAPWVRLPAARASHIVAARNMQKLFTGNLDTAIASTPWFPGDERDLLRAQIARITSTCKLAVGGWWAFDETLNKLNVDVGEDGEPQAGFSGLNELSGWVHAAPFLLVNGRSDYGRDAIKEAHEKEPIMSEFDFATLNEAFDKEEEPDAGKPKLLGDVIAATIDTDAIRYVNILEAGEVTDDPRTKPWSIKAYGDKGTHKSVAGDEESHKVFAVKSRTWPGAVAVAQGKRFANLYVGYGLKCGTLMPCHKASGLPLAGTCPIMPLEPGEVQEIFEQNPEPEDEANEPNPQKDDGEDSAGDKDVSDGD